MVEPGAKYVPRFHGGESSRLLADLRRLARPNYTFLLRGGEKLLGGRKVEISGWVPQETLDGLALLGASLTEGAPLQVVGIGGSPVPGSKAVTIAWVALALQEARFRRIPFMTSAEAQESCAFGTLTGGPAPTWPQDLEGLKRKYQRRFRYHVPIGHEDEIDSKNVNRTFARRLVRYLETGGPKVLEGRSVAFGGWVPEVVLDALVVLGARVGPIVEAKAPGWDILFVTPQTRNLGFGAHIGTQWVWDALSIPHTQQSPHDKYRAAFSQEYWSDFYPALNRDYPLYTSMAHRALLALDPAEAMCKVETDYTTGRKRYLWNPWALEVVSESEDGEDSKETWESEEEPEAPEEPAPRKRTREPEAAGKRTRVNREEGKRDEGNKTPKYKDPREAHLNEVERTHVSRLRDLISQKKNVSLCRQQINAILMRATARHNEAMRAVRVIESC